MRVNRNIPHVGKVACRSGVIEVAMRKNDCGRLRAGPETRFRGRDDLFRAIRGTGSDERPRRARLTYKVDVRNAYRKACHAGCDFDESHITSSIHSLIAADPFDHAKDERSVIQSSNSLMFYTVRKRNLGD